MPTFASNRRAQHEYKILETHEAGIVLQGQEVKSVKAGRMSLQGSYVRIIGGRVLLVGASIARYEKARPDPSYDPERSRALLMKRQEIAHLEGKLKEKGLTGIPLSVYTRKSRIKVEVGVGRGKKLYDHRESLRNKIVKRDIDRAMRRKE